MEKLKIEVSFLGVDEYVEQLGKILEIAELLKSEKEKLDSMEIEVLSGSTKEKI